MCNALLTCAGYQIMIAVKLTADCLQNNQQLPILTVSIAALAIPRLGSLSQSMGLGNRS
jgi:hypothetical protein